MKRYIFFYFYISPAKPELRLQLVPCSFFLVQQIVLDLYNKLFHAAPVSA